MAAVLEHDESEVDPHRHRVWAVSVTISYDTYAVAETEEEAAEVAIANSNEDRDMAVESAWATEVGAPLPVGGDTLPWGPIKWRGKELKLNELVELVTNPPPPGRDVAPIYDTETILMPFVDSPPPIWPEEEATS